ncbi:AraC family transcriptional regulator [Opitutaceae bacterium TAV4]|nr:AraC family transcriptional regulator [Opitutaceae bacterium TAV3]RRK01392.1 AraC family transcriptional regulator [Opitutaceae bacterium TAV4]
MGRILYTIDRLPPPLLLAEERLTTIPRGERLVIPNLHIAPDRRAKIIFFLQADFETSVVGRPPLHIRTGDILFVPLRVMQTYRAMRNVETTTRTLRLVLSPASTTSTDSTLADAFRDIRHLPHGMTPRHHELIHQFRSEIENTRPARRLMTGALALELLVESLRCIHEFITNEHPGTTDLPIDIHIRRAKEYILENYEKPLTLADIARSTRLSREHLARLFHQTTGHTVFDYLTRIRIEAAKSLLCDTTHFANQIATLSGFSSEPLFYRTFKKHTGFTPSVWRRNILKNSEFEPGLRYQPARITEATPDKEEVGNELDRAKAIARRAESPPPPLPRRNIA